jgi:hypothetical protein
LSLPKPKLKQDDSFAIVFMDNPILCKVKRSTSEGNLYFDGLLASIKNIIIAVEQHTQEENIAVGTKNSGQLLIFNLPCEMTSPLILSV